MPASRWREQAPLIACCGIAFAVPLPFIWATLGIWLLAIGWLISGRYAATWRSYWRSPVLLLWLVYFLMHAVGYFFCIDKEESLFDTVGKLSFVLLPFLIGAGMKLNLRGLAAVLVSFAASLAVVSVFCVLQAWHYWQDDIDINHFFYHELTRGLDANAVYMAWYVLGALAALLLFPWREAGYRRALWWRWPIVLLLSAFLVLLASRLMILAYLLIVIPAFGARLLRRYRFWILVPLVSIGVSLGGFYLLAHSDSPVRKRFTDIMHPDMSTVEKDEYAGVEPHWTNLTLRLFVWRMALENMEANPQLWWHGTGNGDVHAYMNIRIASHGIPNMNEHNPERSTLFKVNLHNMYLQSLLMFGIGGLLIFIAIMVTPLFRLGRSEAGWFFGAFQVLSILFMLQESALQTQAGVIYYCFFCALFWAGVKRGEKTPASQLPQT